MSNQARGALTGLYMNGQRFRFLRHDPSETRNPNLIDVSQDTIRGSLDPHDDDVVSDVRVNKFKVTLQPNPLEWTALMPLLGLDNGGAGNVYNLVTDVSTMEFVTYLDFRNDQATEVYKYAICIVDRYVVRCSKGNPLTIDLWINAKQETSDAVGIPATTLLAGRPYVMKQLALTLEGNAHTPNSIAWGMDHHVDAEYNNSETATDICPATREVFLATSTPFFTANERALYTTRRDNPDAGVSATAVFTRGTASMTSVFGVCRLVPKPPAIMSRLKEVRNGLFYKVLRSDATALLQVTQVAP